MDMLYVFLFLLFGIVEVALGEDSFEYGDSCHRAEGLGGTAIHIISCTSKDIQNPLQCGPAGRCECASGLYFNQGQNRCVSPPSGLCTAYSRDGFPVRTCTDFATCWPNEKHDPVHSRQNGTCYCEPDAKEDPHTGLCKLTHDTSRCSKLNDCDVNSLMTCRYGRCQCQDEQYQKYNESSMRCESLVGGSCGVQTKAPFPPAVCHGPNMSCEGGKCVCESGYGKTQDRRCLKVTAKTHICEEGRGGYGGFPRPLARSFAKSEVVGDDEKSGGEGDGAGSSATEQPTD